jgi:hypothetical protein
MREGWGTRCSSSFSDKLCIELADTIERIGGLVRFLISFAVLSMASYGWAQNVVHYTTTNANVKYLFATADPVAHLKSGDILDTNTWIALETGSGN